MRVYISADMEGTAGIAHFEEVGEGDKNRWYDYYSRRMTAEVAAACEGAIAAGAQEVLVKDAHFTGRNIDPLALPRGVRVNRGWSGNPFTMVSGLEGFDALLLTGYHSQAGSPGSPLSHTMNPGITELLINDRPASEMHIVGYAAALLGVPLVFVSGDADLCAEAKEWLPAVTTVATGAGHGDSMIGLHPADAEEAIAAGVKQALLGELPPCVVPLPAYFVTRVTYKEHQKAYHNSFYPGAEQIGPRSILFESGDFHDLLRFYHFVL